MPPRFFGGGEGFLRSGDLGHYDDKGNLYFDGRIKELIKYKNFHLYPNELEEIILKLDGVEDIAVFGVPEPSVQELVTALVTSGHLYWSHLATPDHFRWSGSLRRNCAPRRCKVRWMGRWMTTRS